MKQEDYTEAPVKTKNKRICIICGARVKNQNPKTVTCSPICTAKYHKLESSKSVYNYCADCGIAIHDDMVYCERCLNGEI